MVSKDKHSDPVLAFCQYASGLSGDLAGLIEAHAHAVACLHVSPVPDSLRYRIEDLCDAVLQCHQWVLRYQSGDVDPIAAYAKGQPTLSVYYGHRDRAKTQLEILWKSGNRPGQHVDGYTVGDLRKTAQIGRDLWSKLCKAAKIEVGQGHSHRRFSNADIARLIESAERHNSPKSRVAAGKWRELLAANQISGM